MKRPDSKTLLALAAGFVMPGMGHLYAGEFAEGALILLSVACIVPLGARLAAHASPQVALFVLLSSVIVAVATYVTSAVLAARIVARGRPERAPWQRSSFYCLFVALGYLFVLRPFAVDLRDDWFETFVVPSASMAPTILPGDRLLGDKKAGRPGGTKLWRGAIAIFVYPNDRTLTFIKRVIALPGDRVDIDENGVRVNGKSIELGDATVANAPNDVRAIREQEDGEEYVVYFPRTLPPDFAKTAFTVPDGQLFVLGDNRGHATDSRRFGTVPLPDVKAIAQTVWYSSARGAGIRWNRMGHVLEQ